VAEIERRHPGIRIAGSRHGYFRPEDEPSVVDDIATARPKLLFVALETPAKELFLARHRETLAGMFAMGVGGAFDVLGGARKRAPRWMQRAGLEWLFRLLQEPRRLAPRYVAGNTRFVLLLARELLRRSELTPPPLRWRAEARSGPAAAAGEETAPVVGLVAPFPPQVGGVAAVADWLVRTEQDIGCRYVVFDLVRPAEDEAGGRVTLASLARQVRLTGAFLRWARTAPRLVHFCVSASKAGLARDLVFLGILRAFGTATVAHVHGSDPVHVLRSGFRRSALRALPLLSREIVTISERHALELERRLGVRSTPVLNPVRVEPPEGLDTAPGAADAAVRLVFVGTYGARKGVPELLQALAAVQTRGLAARLRIVGKEERAGEDRALRRETAALGLEGCVEFAGVLFGEELLAEYRCADVFVLPSRNDGLPMALLEAMACGLPPITTPVGGIPDVVEDGRSGILVAPGDVEQLAAAIELLATDRDLRQQLGRDARARVEEVASPRIIAARWREIYRRHLAGRDGLGDEAAGIAAQEYP
jgi:glycosyltransferase involved in cell wall biosynthesis